MIDSKRDLNCLHFLTFDGIQMKNSKLTHEMCDPSYINNKKYCIRYIWNALGIAGIQDNLVYRPMVL